MREIVLDTETTGFDPTQGDRIVEIGAIEILNHLPTGKVFHRYINPQRDMPAEAFAVHGLSSEFLSDKPLFSEIAQEFYDFLGEDSHLVIHNASFDVKFINAELSAVGFPQLPWSRAIDTLDMARRKFPGAQNSLDALCRRFGIDNSGREKHGALLDSELLAEVYLELMGGRQPDLALSMASVKPAKAAPSGGPPAVRERRPPLKATLLEAEAHAKLVNELGEAAIWRHR